MSTLRKLMVFALIVAVSLGGAPASAQEPLHAPASVEGTQAQAIPFKNDETVSQGTLLRILGGLALALIVAYAVVSVLRQRYYGDKNVDGGTRTIRVLETKRLAQKVMLFRIQVHGRELLLGSSGDRLVLLDTHEPRKEGGPHA